MTADSDSATSKRADRGNGHGEDADAVSRQHAPPPTLSFGTIFLAFLRLGLTSFGGPIAHLGYFRDELVERRRWLDDRAYADLVALCQFLPGPASSQVGVGIGILRGGLAGGAAAWLGFTLPSAVLMIGFAFGVGHYGDGPVPGWLVGLKAMAVAVVADAVWTMGQRLCPDRARATLAAAAALLVVTWPLAVGSTAFAQVVAILCGAVVGVIVVRETTTGAAPHLAVPISVRMGWLSLIGFALLLGGLPIAALLTGSGLLVMVDGFYRSGALVFGGGHVLLPLLDAVTVAPGWVSAEQFLAGYGAAQALPGPLFTFAGYLGSVIAVGPGGVVGGLIATVAIFLPGLLLVIGTMPFWNALRSRGWARSALAGVNAAVVGLLLAALYDPLWTTTVQSPLHFAIVVISFVALRVWSLPPWQVAPLAALLGFAVLGP